MHAHSPEPRHTDVRAGLWLPVTYRSRTRSSSACEMSLSVTTKPSGQISKVCCISCPIVRPRRTRRRQLQPQRRVLAPASSQSWGGAARSFELICVVTLGSARREGLRRLRGARRIFTQRQRGGQQQHRIAPKPAAGAALCPPSPCRGGRRRRSWIRAGSSRDLFFFVLAEDRREKRGREKLPRRG